MRRLFSIGLILTALVAIVVLVLVAGPTPGARAAAIVVTTTDDELNADGDCSLREAIVAANTDAPVDACTAGSSADTITLPAGTYILSLAGAGEDVAATGDLDITTGPLTITGAGEANTIIEGDGTDRIFHIFTPLGTQIEISDVTIRNGSTSVFGRGGGIQNSGTLTLNNVTLSDNSAFNGGGIDNNGSLTLNNSTVSFNTTTGNSGAGIVSGGTLTLNNSTVSGNSTTDTNRVGGGIGIFGGTVNITNSTISGNTTTGDGGGIYVNQDEKGGPTDVTLINTTISDNTADSDTDGSGSGGGIAHVGGTVEVKNTIVAGNQSGDAGGPDCSGTLTSLGNNLIQYVADCTIAGDTSGNITGAGPQLGPLADNGGPTQTQALLAGSPAIDAGDDAACPAADQRGVGRPQDGDLDSTAVCDIGAYEFEPTAAPAPTPTPTVVAAILPATGANSDGSRDVAALFIVALAGLGASLAAAGFGALRLRRR